MEIEQEEPLVVSPEVFHQYHVVIDGILSLSTCPLCVVANRKTLPVSDPS